MQKRLYKSTKNVMISGVCAGIADYFGIDPTIIRLLWVVLSVFTVGLGGLIAYIACAIIIPKDTNVG